MTYAALAVYTDSAAIARTHARTSWRMHTCVCERARARSLAHLTWNADAKAKHELASSKRANNAGCRRWFNKRVVSQITVRHVAHTDAAHREMPNNATTRTDDTPTAVQHGPEMRNDSCVAPQPYLTARLDDAPLCAAIALMFIFFARDAHVGKLHGALSL